MPSFLGGNALFRGVYCLLSANQGNAEHCTPVGETIARQGVLPAGLEWLAFMLAGLSIVMLLINSFLLLVMLYTYMERRLLGRFQSRLGPNRTGPLGLLQPVADAIKLLSKEDTIPEGADRWVFNLAPIVMIVPLLMVLAVLPFGRDSFLANINVGILFIFAVTSITTLAMFMAGWASGNRYAMFGGMRAVAQLISYEVPVLLSVVGILLMVGSMSLIDIVEKQQVPFLLIQPLAFFIFVTASSAEMNRSPFDLVEADSEIIAGYHTEYSGMKFGMFQLTEFGAVLVTSGIIATLFLKGWEGPLLPSYIWFLLKVFLLAFMFIWVRATIPRLRIDQVMAFAWKFLIPLSIVNMFVIAFEVLLLGTEVNVDGVIHREFTAKSLWIMGGINWGVMVLGIVTFSQIVSKRTKHTVALGPMPNLEVS